MITLSLEEFHTLVMQDCHYCVLF